MLSAIYPVVPSAGPKAGLLGPVRASWRALLFLNGILLAAGCIEGGQVTEPAQPAEAAQSPAAVSGTYDVVASIESYDPAWRISMDGGYYTAVVTLESLGSTDLRGTYTNWRVVLPAENWEAVVGDGTAVATGYRDGNGTLYLDADKLSWHMQGTLLHSGSIEGRWGCCGHIVGSFTATRRPPE